jgi:hypothetical protein
MVHFNRFHFQLGKVARMAREITSRKWLTTLTKVFGAPRKGIIGPHRRRLGAESLEGRMVLSATPWADGGESLADYLGHEQEMGPLAPAEVATTYDQEILAYAVEPFFGPELPEGEDCEEGQEGCGEGGGGEEGSGSSTSTVTGSVGLDGLVGSLNCSVEGASGSFSMDEQGNFVFEMENPEIGTEITITVTDSEGNTSTSSFFYNG